MAAVLNAVRGRCGPRADVRLDSSGLSCGIGGVLGIFSGLRGAVADALWLRMNDSWEARDPVATAKWIEIVSAVDPGPLYFWVNGARVVAYDIAQWRLDAEGGPGGAGEAVRQRIAEEQGMRALARIAEAMKAHPASAALWIERAELELFCVRDVEAAAASFRRASEQPDAPFFAARVYAELLRRLGRKREALEWLVQLHPRLPANEPAADAEVVLARIRALEEELGTPFERRYRPMKEPRRFDLRDLRGENPPVGL
ncbi:MAG: hypothetical protein JWM88_3329 [Verrucomicrobia bacterium]|nr:hypothetical protein [Verrucomicrobiota bacterium]